jgi:hypothetical protein
MAAVASGELGRGYKYDPALTEKMANSKGGAGN